MKKLKVEMRDGSHKEVTCDKVIEWNAPFLAFQNKGEKEDTLVALVTISEIISVTEISA